MIVQLRHRLRAPLVPWWLSDRRISSGKWVGYRILWCVTVVLDVLTEIALQGLFAAWPGKGTPTALGWVGRSRLMRRAQNEGDASYAERLRGWLAKHAEGSSARGIAMAVHAYLQDHPMVRVVSRGGTMVTVRSDGSVETRDGVAWDWDSVSYPERAGNWWEQWIIVYTQQFPPRPKWGEAGKKWGADGFGFGHFVPRQVVSDLLAEVEQMKALRSLVRTIVLTTDPTRFDPDVPSSMPDGTWGHWIGNRDTTTCRFWETQ